MLTLIASLIEECAPHVGGGKKKALTGANSRLKVRYGGTGNGSTAVRSRWHSKRRDSDIMENSNQGFDGHPDAVKVTPQCAAVLLVGGGVVGATVAATVLPALLYILGFSSGGVLGNSFAASWQSTMPLVAQGSLFAALQSAAASGVGSTVMISAAAVGSTSGALLMQQTCSAIDNVPAGSAEQALVLLFVKVYTQLSPLSQAARDGLQDTWKTTLELATRTVAVATNATTSLSESYRSGNLMQHAVKAMEDAGKIMTQTVEQANHAAQNTWMQHMVSSHGMQEIAKTQSAVWLQRGRQVYRRVLAGISRMTSEGDQRSPPEYSGET